MAERIKEDFLIPPYGGKLVNLIAEGDEREELVARASQLPSIRISPRALCDLELLASGAFSPLDRFMGKADYERVLSEMRLSNDVLFPIPITLSVNEQDLPRWAEQVTLSDVRNNTIAVMNLEEVFHWDPRSESLLVLGTTDPRHPLMSEMIRWGRVCISGEIKVINPVKYHDFVDLRRTPVQVRALLNGMGSQKVVAYQTRQSMHRAHEELVKRAAEEIGGSLLIHPAVGMAKTGEIDHYARIRIYRTLVENYFDKDQTLLSLTSLAPRMAGPREALWHAIIRRNYGATHFVVDRDHASPGKDSHGKDFYPPGSAFQWVAQHAHEIGVQPVEFKQLVYSAVDQRYEEEVKIPVKTRVSSISETQVWKDYLAKGIPLPGWFTRAETAEILSEMYPPTYRQGVCLWFTGLSGAGKSTTAEIVTSLLLERGRQVTLLDGDVVRTHLSKGLGFSRQDRDTNILRIGYVAGEIARHGGTVICAAISPYRATRNEVRKMVGEDRFVEVFVDTPIEVCETRDVKGLYARARRGQISGFTGIDDIYEEPVDPELTLNTERYTAFENAHRIIEYLEERGFILHDGISHSGNGRQRSLELAFVADNERR